MGYSLKTGMVVGTTGKRVWCQVSTQAVPEGQLLLLVRVKYLGEGDLFEPATVGAEFLESLKLRLIQAVEVEQIKKELERVKEDIGEEVVVEVAIVLQRGEKLMTVGEGMLEVYLQRGEKLSKLWGLEPKPVGLEGVIEEGDVLFLVTQEMGAYLEESGWGELWQNERGLEQLAVKVHAQTDSSGLALLLGRVEKQQTIKQGARKINWAQVVSRVKSWGKSPLKIKEEQRKRNTLVAMVLLGLLIVGIGVGLLRRSQLVRAQRYQRTEEMVLAKITEAESIADLNPERAKALVEEAYAAANLFIDETNEDEEATRGIV